jgi:hypothetical protein
LVSSCSRSGPKPAQQPSITFSSQASTTPGMVGHWTPAFPAPGTSHTESSTTPPVPDGRGRCCAGRINGVSNTSLTRW